MTDRPPPLRTSTVMRILLATAARRWVNRISGRFGKAFRKPPPAVVVFFKGDFLGFDWSKQGGGVFYVPGVDSKKSGTYQLAY